jgi:hypothetical protein
MAAWCVRSFRNWTHSRPLDTENLDRVSGLVELASAGIRSDEDSLRRTVFVPNGRRAP